MNKLIAWVISGLALTCQANWNLIDDFDSYDNSAAASLGATPGNRSGDVWVGVYDGTSGALITDDDDPEDNSVAAFYTAGWRGLETDLKNSFSTDLSLPDGDIATYFFQLMAEGSATDCMIGLSESTDSVDESNSWMDFAVMPYVNSGNLKVYSTSGGDQTIQAMTDGEWYNIWLVINNGAKTFDIYVSTGTDAGMLAYSGLSMGRITAPGNLEAFAIMNNGTDRVHVDNLYRSVGETLSNPLPGGSDPSASATACTPSPDPVYAGTPLILSASVTGTQPITYLWQTDGMSGGSNWSNLSGSVTNAYMLDTADLVAGSYQYRLVVTNSVGAYTNIAATVLISAASAPMVVDDISFDPAATVVAGEAVTVSASFEGTLPICYQWQLDGVDIAGATNASYTMTTGYSDAGSYSLVASNQIGSTVSAPAALSVVAFIPNVVGGALAGVTNETVYLMCYHEGYYPAGGSSGVFLSWSTNGYDFNPLNDAHPLFVPPEFPGDDADNTDDWANLVRDPSMVYGPDGLFHLVYTSDINSRSFGYAESPDLVHWSNIKLVQVWQNETNSIGHTWAPEIFYDDVRDRYQIAFSSNVGTGTLRLYYTLTSDFETFSDPEELFWYPDGSWEQIDACVAKVEADYYVMVYKENAEIWLMDSTLPSGSWSNAVQVTSGGDEGPCIVKIGDAWHVYWDNYGYTDDVFGLTVSYDLENWTEVTSQANLPKKADVPDYGYDGGPPHHGTVFAAPLSALGAFTAPMQDNVTNLTSLVYRWSFEESEGAVSDGGIVMDSVSGAAAVVSGDGAEFTGSGLLLPGDTDGTGGAAYIDLPNGMISSLTNLTVEIWATPQSSKSWQRLFSFGRTAESGEGGGEWSGPASAGISAEDVLFWSINQGSDISRQRLTMQLNGGEFRAQSDTCVDTVAGTQYHFVFTFEDGTGFFGASGGRMSFYRDGYRIGWRDVAFRLQDLEDVNNWLGRSQWSGDSNSNVEYNEVRIYSEALSWYEVYGHYQTGPDVAVQTLPALSLKCAGGTNTLIWPGNSIGVTLQHTEVLSSSNQWMNVTNEATTTTEGIQVEMPLPDDHAFYRLGR